MALLETPSRIWRRIEADEQNDLPSLPELPTFEDSNDVNATTTSEESHHSAFHPTSPLQSTPAPPSNQTTIRLQSSKSSSTRFAQSITSRASRSGSGFSSSTGSVSKCSPPSISTQRPEISFDDISAIPSYPQPDVASVDEAGADVDEDGLDDDMSLADALRPSNRSGSPFPLEGLAGNSNSKYNYSGSLRSEPKMSPFDKMRNVSFRKPIPRMRTPSLTLSPSSSSSNSTPHSSEPPGQPQLSRTPSPSVLSIPPPEGSDEGEPMSLSDLAAPSEVSEAQELEQDLEQALDSGDYFPVEETAEETGQVQSVADSEEHQEEPSPTFSSEEPTAHPRYPSATPRASTDRAESQSPQALTVEQSSPAPSVMFTPTPAFPPRPRPRFFAPGLPSTPAIATTDHSELDNKDLVTPYARRRSFLIDVINSTARPRFAHPTPHPTRTADDDEERDSMSPDSSSQPSSKKSAVDASDTTVKPFGAAFAGFTPAPRQRTRTAGRLSHPLSRGWTGPGSESEEVGGGASFTSTASSHDLTAHPRANASFDQVIGLGAGGHGIGRFNAGKLNAYLHGLNRRLQEESESLTGHVGLLRKENLALAEANAVLQEEMEHLRQQTFTSGAGSRRSSAGRRLSDMGPTLGEVKEDAGAEEKMEMEAELDELRAELNECRRERDGAIAAVEAERAERSRDKERWRERMVEVERGVEGIIQDLEARLEKAEAVARDSSEKDGLLEELEKALKRVEEEAASARTRADSAEMTLESQGELGSKLLEVNGKLAKSTAALHDLQSHVEQLEDEIADADQNLREEHLRAKKLQDDLKAKDVVLEDLERKLSGQRPKLQESDRELQDAKAYITELEADAGLAMDHIEALQQEILDAHEKATGDDGAIAKIKQESERNAELATQLEDALDAAEQKMRADEEALAELRNKVVTLERERDRAEKSRTEERNAELEEAENQIEVLERELDDAHREISRLNSELAHSPARKALDKARDAKIELLEKEKEDLQERLNGLKHEIAVWNTPGKFSNANGISPMHRQVLNMTLKTPKTPGAPLRDMSWLHMSPSDPSSVAQYIMEIQRLEMDLGRANESIDEKLDRLEHAGFGNVELETRLNDERAKTAALEEDIARLDRREERRLRRLAKAKCPHCRHHVDLRGLNRVGDGDESTLDVALDVSMLSYASESTPVKTSDAVKDDLRAVNRELTSMKKQWQEERRQLLGDNAVLKDAADRLDLQMRDARARAEHKERTHEKARAGVLDELDEAKQAIADFEGDLKAERSRLRVLTVEQTRAEREKENVLLQLRRTESDMEDVKLQLQRIKRNNNELEGELRANATAEQKARLLEVKAEENAETIEQLRHERSLLAAEHKKLQQRFKKAMEQMDRLREEQRISQKSHNGRRHALDLQKLEVEELKRALADHADVLQATEAANIRAAAAQAREREQGVVVASLEADLTRVRRSAESLGRDLRAERKRREEENTRRDAERKAERSRARKEVEETRRELEKILREKKQVGTELRLLHERLDLLEGEKRSWDRHACAADSGQLSALRNQHRLECKGLIVQIHYLKAKFTRENTLRMDLSYQKRYLLILLGRRERSEEHILAMIARITSPTPGPSPHKQRRKTLRAVAQGIVFIQRMKRASEIWRAQCAPKPAIKAALEDVRRRRKQQTRHL